MLINGVELEFDLMDINTLEKYEDIHNDFLDKLKNAQLSTKDKKTSEVLKVQCELICDFFNDIFGGDTHNKIFGDSLNYRVCFDTFEKFIGEINKQLSNDEKHFKSISSRYNPNRLHSRNSK